MRTQARISLCVINLREIICASLAASETGAGKMRRRSSLDRCQVLKQAMLLGEPHARDARARLGTRHLGLQPLDAALKPAGVRVRRGPTLNNPRAARTTVAQSFASQKLCGFQQGPHFAACQPVGAQTSHSGIRSESRCRLHDRKSRRV